VHEVRVVAHEVEDAALLGAAPLALDLERSSGR